MVLGARQDGEYFGICSPTGIFPQYYLQGVHTMD